MKAGPLLQTLLLAGPLPQWRHPPPPLDSFEIPLDSTSKAVTGNNLKMRIVEVVDDLREALANTLDRRILILHLDPEERVCLSKHNG
ncbi:formin-like protein 2 [Senna tora]|uniref:Formin-like protein 2 n=1 Tax=Senna tora TaxID=362788 RepID=A0A834WV99_9FABA|nr:formin-like protein 2 [Senna tora]